MPKSVVHVLVLILRGVHLNGVGAADAEDALDILGDDLGSGCSGSEGGHLAPDLGDEERAELGDHQREEIILSGLARQPGVAVGAGLDLPMIKKVTKRQES